MGSRSVVVVVVVYQGNLTVGSPGVLNAEIVDERPSFGLASFHIGEPPSATHQPRPNAHFPGFPGLRIFSSYDKICVLVLVNSLEIWSSLGFYMEKKGQHWYRIIFMNANVFFFREYIVSYTQRKQNC